MKKIEANKIKTKIFSDSDQSNLCEKINFWLGDKNHQYIILDMQYSYIYTKLSLYEHPYSVFIIYTELD